MSHRVRELRRFDSTDTCDSTGSDDGTLVVRKVRRKSTVQEGQPAGFVPKSANQNSPAPKENENESPTKSTNQVVSQLKGDSKGLSPPPNNRSNINNNSSKGSTSSVASNQSQQSSVASALAKDVEDPMEPIQLPKPGSISVPDIPQAQPRQMIYSLHSKPTPEVPLPAAQSPYEGHQKVVLPVRLGSAGNPPPANEQLYVDDGYQNGYNPRPSYPQQGPQSSSRDNSRRSSYATPYNDPNASGMQDYNRIDAFSYDAQQDPMSPRTYGHGLTSPPSNQHHSQVTSPYYQSQDAPIEYSPNPMHTANHHQSPPPPSQQYAPAAHKVQRIGASNSSVANSQVSGYTSVSSSSSYTANRSSAPPVRPPSPDAKKNDRLRTIVLANMSETEQIRIALLISTQDEKYGTNMFDSLNANDHVEIETMVQRGYKQEQALMTIFKRKFEPLGSTTKSPSRRPSVGPGPGSVNSGGYDSEASSHAPAPMLGHGHSRQPSYAGDYNSQGTPQTARSREYIGYHPEDDSEYYQQQNGGYNNDDFDDGRSYTSHQQDNYSVRSGVSRNDQRVGASGHHRTSSGGAQNFVGYIDSYEPPVAALESMSITGGSLPPAPPPRRLYSAHSTSSLSRTSYPMSNNGHDGASGHGSSGHLPRTRSSYDRSEFATYDQYNAHPPVPGGSRALSRTMTPDSGYHDASAAPQHHGHVPYYMQDYEQHQQGYGYANGNTAQYHGGDEYYGDQYQQSGTYASSNPSPRNNNNGYFSSGNSVVSAGGDRRIAANYASPPHGGSGSSTSGAYNTYYNR